MGSDNKFNDTIRLISNAIKTNPLDLLQEDDVADEQRRTQEKESALAQANARLIDEKARKAKDKSDLEQIAANYESAKITKEELIHEVGLLLKEAKKDGDGYIENIKSLAHSNVPTALLSSYPRTPGL